MLGFVDDVSMLSFVRVIARRSFARGVDDGGGSHKSFFFRDNQARPPCFCAKMPKISAVKFLLKTSQKSEFYFELFNYI